MNEFYTKSGTVTRQSWSNDSSSEISIATIDLHLQPGIGNAQKYMENIAQSFTKPYTMWCAEGTDIQEGDTVTISTADYSVQYVSDWDVGDSDDHLEVLLEKL